MTVLTPGILARMASQSTGRLFFLGLKASDFRLSFRFAATVRATMDVFLQALSWTVGYTTIRVSGQYRHAVSLH